MNWRYLSIFLLFLLSSPFAKGQDEALAESLLRKGNRVFNQEDYEKAIVQYRKSLDAESNFGKARYNLGNTLYKQERFAEATQQLEMASSELQDTLMKAMAFHNMGNAYMELESFSKATKAYKSALRLNPSDEETRYNLAFALKMMGGKDDNEDEQDDEENELTEFAKKLKETADELVAQRRYKEAYDMMKSGSQQDASVSKHYGQYINRLGEILGINENPNGEN